VNRIVSVDVFKLLAITAVIAIHTEPFRGSASGESNLYQYLGVLINQLSRFAVPFFFVISGYFWGTKIKGSVSVASVSISIAKRICLIFAAWSVIYALPYNISSIFEHGLLGSITVAYCNLINLSKDPVTLMMQGTKVHLWFLIALLFSLGISSLLVEKEKQNTLIAISVMLYLIGLLARAYSDTPLGIHINFNTRNGPFFGTIFFVSGYFLANRTPEPGWFSKGVTLLGVGWIFHFSELYVLCKLFGTNPYQDYVIGTYLMGIGAAMVSLSNNALFRNDTLGDVGKLTLGIYGIHFVFVDILRPLDILISAWPWKIGYIVLVLLFSAVSVMILSKSKYTRSIII